MKTPCIRLTNQSRKVVKATDPLLRAADVADVGTQATGNRLPTRYWALVTGTNQNGGLAFRRQLSFCSQLPQLVGMVLKSLHGPV
jgi:hypothetical protein